MTIRNHIGQVKKFSIFELATEFYLVFRSSVATLISFLVYLPKRSYVNASPQGGRQPCDLCS
jgi:hypothetical protein